MPISVRCGMVHNASSILPWRLLPLREESRRQRSFYECKQPMTLSDDEAGIQVDELATVLFCGVLCHQARLSLKTEFEI